MTTEKSQDSMLLIYLNYFLICIIDISGQNKRNTLYKYHENYKVQKEYSELTNNVGYTEYLPILQVQYSKHCYSLSADLIYPFKTTIDVIWKGTKGNRVSKDKCFVQNWMNFRWILLYKYYEDDKKNVLCQDDQ